MKQHAIRLTTEFNLAVLSTYEKGREFTRRALARTRKLRNIDLPGTIHVGRVDRNPRAKLNERASGIIRRLLRGSLKDGGNAISVPPTVALCDPIRLFAPDVCEREPQIRAVARELRKVRVRKRRSLELSEPVRASIERARQRRGARG